MRTIIRVFRFWGPRRLVGARPADRQDDLLALARAVGVAMRPIDFGSASVGADNIGKTKLVWVRLLACGHTAALHPVTSGSTPPPATGVAWCWECGQTVAVVGRTTRTWGTMREEHPRTRGRRQSRL